MCPFRLESGPMIAWVGPLAGGLLDFSCRDGSAPKPLLRRSPPEQDSPAWLAIRPRLGGTFAGAESARWSLLDRTPLSARLRYESQDGAACMIRYELSPDSLLVGLRSAPLVHGILSGALLINGISEELEIVPVRGFGRVRLHDQRDATCPIRIEPGEADMCALILRYAPRNPGEPRGEP